MQGVIDEILVDREVIRRRVKELGEKISKDYKDESLVLIGVLKGGFIFMADLVREIDMPVELDFISVSSYGDSTKSSGVVRIIKDIDINIINKHVLIVEDIVDTGLTLNHLKELFNTRGPKSIKICSAFDKPSRRKVQIEIDYKVMEIPDKFVVGYGLDYAGKFRNLPDVCVYNPKLCSK